MPQNKSQNDLISVIIPVYNVEKYLCKCVDSVIAQTRKNLEIILIDDESPDRCGEICDEYAKKDSRVAVIHKKNSGLADVRNVGIKIAKGDFIGFVDSDDYIENDMYEILLELIKKYDADVACCGINNVYDDRIIPQYKGDEEFCVNAEEAFKLLLEGKKVPGSSCNKIFKSSMIKKLKFPKGMLYEDAFFTADYMMKIKSMAVSTIPKYFYIHRSNSITTSIFKTNSKDMHAIKAYEKTYNVVKSNFPKLLKQAEFRLIWSNFIVFDRILALDDYKNIPEFSQVRDFLKRNALNAIFNNNFNKKRRIAAFVLLCNVRLYRDIMMKTNNKICN